MKKSLNSTGIAGGFNGKRAWCAPMNEQPNNPLHGITLEKLLIQLVDHYGWEELGRRIDIRCFNWEPSIKSSLKFLRKTQWARDKVEQLYIDTKF
jgi:uncharacterized protein (DUF2132 family)